jgi:hypothetical protein
MKAVDRKRRRVSAYASTYSRIRLIADTHCTRLNRISSSSRIRSAHPALACAWMRGRPGRSEANSQAYGQ